MIRVAIVEDDAEVQGVLQEYVRRYTRQYGTEFEVTVFADGVDILEDYRAVYDIIFLDVEMKHLDGMTTAERIRARRWNGESTDAVRYEYDDYGTLEKETDLVNGRIDKDQYDMTGRLVQSTTLEKNTGAAGEPTGRYI